MIASSVSARPTGDDHRTSTPERCSRSAVTPSVEPRRDWALREVTDSSARIRDARIECLSMVVDAHGHYTTVPAGLRVFRVLQISQMGKPLERAMNISDDEIRAWSPANIEPT